MKRAWRNDDCNVTIISLINLIKKTAHETQLDKNNVEKKHNKLMSLAWYYTMKGNEIKPNKE